MLVLALLLAQVPAAAPAATPKPATTAAPSTTARPAALGRSSAPARAKTLSEHASEMKAQGAAPRKVSFDDVKTADPNDVAAAAATDPAKRAAGRTAGGDAATEEARKAAEAQKRMDRAVERGLAMPERGRGSGRDNARREWDEAADACRKTPGCVPRYRDGADFGANKPLKTDHELIDDIRKRGFSEPHPLPK